jgi:DNA-binding response OmpR family regulator
MAEESERSLDIHPDVRGAAGDGLQLTGESPRTDRADDAAHWMNIYRELITFQESVLARNGHDRHPAAEDGGAPVSLDMAALNFQLKNYRRRLDFWYDRHWELRGLSIDSHSLVATYGEHRVHLARRELQLLSVFLANAGQTFAASVLAQRAWSDSRLSNDQVRIYVARLRARLGDLGLPCRVVSHPRRGYSFECD